MSAACQPTRCLLILMTSPSRWRTLIPSGKTCAVESPQLNAGFSCWRKAIQLLLVSCDFCKMVSRAGSFGKYASKLCRFVLFWNMGEKLKYVFYVEFNWKCGRLLMLKNCWVVTMQVYMNIHVAAAPMHIWSCPKMVAGIYFHKSQIQRLEFWCTFLKWLVSASHSLLLLFLQMIQHPLH